MDNELKKANITLIARKCGVSKMTVSRVLRQEPNVSASTREMVLKAARKAGFMPSGFYQAKETAARNYYILFQEECSVNDAYFSGIILSIQRELFERGFGCSFGVIKNDYSEFLALNKILRAGEVQGVLVVGEAPTEYVNSLQANFLNLIFIDYPGDPGIVRPYNAVCTDNVYGANLAINHLLKLGRRRILLIAGREDHYFSRDLSRAYMETLARQKIEIDSRLIVHADFHVTGGFEAVKRVMDAGIPFDAVFSNDEMACGAINALRQAGRRVPEEVAVVGFDGLPIGEVVSPGLTTVVVDREKMGRLAVRRLLEIEEETAADEKFEKISLFPKLLIRGSCGGRNE